MPFALVANTKVIPVVSSGGTSPSADTTGANLIVLSYSLDRTQTATLSDNKGNTYTKLTERNDGAASKVGIAYCSNPTVGSGHTFTISGNFSDMMITAWSGAAATSVFDVEAAGGSSVSSTTVQPGSITPSQANSLIISTLSSVQNTPTTVSINGGFAISDQSALAGGLNYGNAQAYLIQTAASSSNPTWTDTSTPQRMVATSAIFKSTPGPSTSNRQFPITISSRQAPVTASIRKSPVQ